MRLALISKIDYLTFANYSPRGVSEISIRSRAIVNAVKTGNPKLIAKLIAEIQSSPELFGDFLGPDVTLVPTPRSSPLRDGSFWPSGVLADALLEANLVGQVLPCLTRSLAVPKSATASPGNRPSVDTHYNSFEVNSSLLAPTNITIIDDVLTKGSTVFAGAMRLKEAFPNSNIRVFAVMRTMGLIPEIIKLRDITIGEIKYTSGYINRVP